MPRVRRIPYGYALATISKEGQSMFIGRRLAIVQKRVARSRRAAARDAKRA